MNTDYRSLLPTGFSEQSRVWIYQSPRLLFIKEALELEEDLQHFLSGWQAHGSPIKGYGHLFFGQFLVLIADETQTTVSGCSTDSSVRFVKSVGEKFKLDFFNRTLLAFYVKEKVETIPMAQLQWALSQNIIGSDTIYFNPVVNTLQDLRNNWMIPVGKSWLASKLPQSTS